MNFMNIGTVFLEDLEPGMSRSLTKVIGPREVEMFAEAEDRYFLRAANVELVVVRDDAGRVAAVDMIQPRGTVRARRKSD